MSEESGGNEDVENLKGGWEEIWGCEGSGMRGGGR